MKNFMNDDFLLNTETAKTLFHETAEGMPIIDFHNHLDPKAIYEDKCFDNLSEVWLSGDHYKWRAMRTNGISERLITGDGEAYEKFLAWADTIQNSFGNPLYHWTHLELQRYFGIEDTLSPDTAKDIWKRCNKKLQTRAFSVRNLLRMQRVKVLCTTDDPADSLEWHKKLKEEALDFQVLPTFRPEKALGIEKKGFMEYIRHLSDVSGISIENFDTLFSALLSRLDYFREMGCVVTDHSLETDFYLPAKKDEVNAIFQKKIAGQSTTNEENGKYRGYLLTELGKAYAERNMVMQLHIGAIRNTASRFYERLGADTGFDSMNDFNYAPMLAALLDQMDQEDRLPKTILYCLNSKDFDMLSVMAGNFQSNEDGIRGKVQLGSAWWFLDHKTGMEHQLNSLSSTGLLSAFIGMLTDSRSFLSFPRHEYFRRILCNYIADLVENGEYPADMEYLKKMVRGICAENAIRYFGF